MIAAVGLAQEVGNMGQILDQYGRPLKREVLKESQTSRVAQLNRQWPMHPSKGLSIRKLPHILEAAERGDLSAQADLFEDMLERDGHIFSEMAKRKNALLTLDWSIEPPENATAAEKKLAMMVSSWLKSIPDMEDIILNAADAIGHGFAAQEIETWELEENVWLPTKTTPETNDEIRLNDGTFQGSELWPFGWLVHTHNAKPGFIAQSGLYRVLVWPYLFKNYALRDMAEFLEIYGLPLRVGKFMTGATDKEKDSLLHALVTLGHDAAGIIPEGSSIEFQSAATGQSDPFQAMIDWAERTESKVILGATLTSQADGKSSTNALGNVHNDVRHDILVSDARQLEGFFRGFIRMLLALNGEDVSARRQPKLVFDTRDIEDIKVFSEGVSNLVSAGMKSIPTSWIHKKLGIPVPQQGEEVLVAPAPAPMSAGLSLVSNPQRFTSFAALSTTPEVDDPAQVMLDEAQTVPEAINQAMDKLISPLVAALSQGQSPDEAINVIAASYPALDDSQLQQLLTQAIFVADIWGHLNAES
jgi:phage gp29-like protein